MIVNSKGVELSIAERYAKWNDKASLIGAYEQTRFWLTWPRVNGQVRAEMSAHCDAMLARLEELGEKFRK